MKKLISFLLIAMLLSCNTSKKTKEVLVIDLAKLKPGKILLSDIANEIEYFPLENKFPIGSIYSYKVTTNFIYAALRNVGVVKFSKDGKLKKRYGKIGRGPGEYVYCHKFALDNQNGTVYVMDQKMQDIEVYNQNGDHIREIKLPVGKGGFGFSDLEFVNSSLFLAQFINMGHGEYDWFVIDTLGVNITKKLNPYPEFNGRRGNISSLSKINDNILYWDNFKDTVFHISTDFNSTPACIFVKGEHKFPMTTAGYNPSDKFFKNISNFMMLLNFLETTQFFIFQYDLNESLKLTLFDKKNSVANVIELKESENGIKNDLDNGLSFNPEKYFEIEDKKYLATFIQPFELKKHVASYKFKNSTPKYPEKKKELEQLANTLDESDNPILMLVKLKE